MATGRGDAFFCFHHINAFEDGDEVVVDLCAYEDPSVIEALEVSKLRAGDSPPPHAFPTRYRVPLSGGDVRGERLSEEPLELPRIDYGRHNGRPYRYVYGGRLGRLARSRRQARRGVRRDAAVGAGRAATPASRCSCADRTERQRTTACCSRWCSTPRRGGSFLAVLDARTLEELARAEAPHAIPFGFHGQFFR